MALDEPAADDKIEVINEIQVAFETEIVPYTQDLVLEYDKERNGIVLTGNESGC